MLKILTSKSDLKPYFKQCVQQKLPCVTLQFHKITASVHCDFDTAGIKLSLGDINSMLHEAQKIIDKNSILAKRENFTPAIYPDFKIDISVAYKCAMEITKLLYKYAGLSFPDLEKVNGIPLVEPVEELQHTLKIRCPYCGMIHSHGKNGDGLRESHCETKFLDNVGYIIKR